MAARRNAEIPDFPRAGRRPIASKRARGAAVLLGLSLAAAACSSGSTSTTTTGGTTGTGATTTTSGGSSSTSTTTSTTIATVKSTTVWLCRPGAPKDPCTDDLDSTIDAGSSAATTTESARPAADPTTDCFYVYPTVSLQPGANANLHIDPEETDVARAQASQFSQVCRVWAPMYRQLTLAAISKPGLANATSGAIAYDTLRSAWLDYLANDNHGRPVVFIGHSQGAALLIDLLRKEVDPKPAVRRLLISAILLGGNVTVPIGKTVGGDFQHIPACATEDETGCVIAYSSFLVPPPSNTFFGRVGQGVSSLSGSGGNSKLQVLCDNPAALSSGGDGLTGGGDLKPYFTTFPVAGVALGAGGGSAKSPEPWVQYPGLYTARCESSAGATWLQVNTATVGGRPVVTQILGPTWGLHLVDVNLAIGNFLSIVRTEEAHYSG